MSDRFVHPAIDCTALGRLGRVMERWREEEGVTEVALPWVASRASVDATCPPERPPPPATPYGHLVASGEQAFLHLVAHRRLPDEGGFIGWTPCFRDETFDAQHHFAFLKAELFVWVDEQRPLHQVIALVERARRVLQQETNEPILPVPLADGMGSEIHGVEIGSYGVRSVLDGSRRYLYGTAIAEPRFSYAIGRSPA